MPSRHAPRPHHVILAGIVLVGLVLRSWGLAWGLQNADVSRRPHPDEWPVYWLFRWFDAGHSLNPCPTPGTRCFFDWGGLFPYLAYAFHFVLSPFFALLPVHTFGSHADPTFVHSVLAGRITSVVVSTATIVVVYCLAGRAYGIRARIVAALLVALSGLLIQLAHFATPDATTNLLVCCVLLALYSAVQQPSLARFALAGTLLGLAAGTEYHMVLLAVPLGTAWVLTGRRRAAWLVAAGGGVALAYLVSNPYTVVETHPFLLALEHTIRIRTVESGAQYFGRWAPYDPAWLYVVRYPLGYGVGFAFAALMLAGTAWAWIRREKLDLLLLSWILPYFALVTLSPTKFMRYSAPLLPPLAILAGRLIGDGSQARRFELGFAAAASLVLATLYSGAYDAAYAGLFSSTDPRLTALQWMEQHVAHGSEVAFDELPNGLVNLPYFALAAGYRACFGQFQPQSLRGSPRFMLVDAYEPEDHARVSDAQVRRFEQALRRDASYLVVERVHYVPTFLGLRFPIDGSPHDWRYPSHDVTVYRHQTAGQSLDRYCYASYPAAVAALYRSHPQG